MKKTIVMIILLSGIGILGWQIREKLSASPSGPQKRGAPSVAVEVEPVKTRAIREIGRFTGSLYPISEYTVAPKVGGRLEKMLVDIGDTVHANQSIAALDNAEYQQQISEAQAELEVARAGLQERRNALDSAKREYERTVALRGKKIASEAQLDAAESEYKIQQAKLNVSLAQVAQKEAALKMAKVRLSYTQIKMQQSSESAVRVVGERFVDEGAMLAANSPIVSILEIGRLKAVIHVIERDYAKFSIGLAAAISTDAFPNRTFSGKVVRIAPLLKENSREARVEIEILNSDLLLKPGMFIRAQVEFEEHPNATVVPVSAIVRRNGKQGVYTVDLDDQKARFIPIVTGIIENGDAEVLDPPLTGSVVTLGNHLLEEGTSVILPGSKPSQKRSG